MSMKEHPASGYVAKLSSVLAWLNQEIALRLVSEDNDGEAVCELLGKILPAEMAKPVEVFQFGDEDSSDDLEQGEWYVRWDEDDLYSRMEKPELKELHRAGIKPELCHWSMWG